MAVPLAIARRWFLLGSILAGVLFLSTRSVGDQVSDEHPAHAWVELTLVANVDDIAGLDCEVIPPDDDDDCPDDDDGDRTRSSRRSNRSSGSHDSGSAHSSGSGSQDTASTVRTPGSETDSNSNEGARQVRNQGGFQSSFGSRNQGIRDRRWGRTKNNGKRDRRARRGDDDEDSGSYSDDDDGDSGSYDDDDDGCSEGEAHVSVGESGHPDSSSIGFLWIGDPGHDLHGSGLATGSDYDGGRLVSAVRCDWAITTPGARADIMVRWEPLSVLVPDQVAWAIPTVDWSLESTGTPLGQVSTPLCIDCPGTGIDTEFAMRILETQPVGRYEAVVYIELVVR